MSHFGPTSPNLHKETPLIRNNHWVLDQSPQYPIWPGNQIHHGWMMDTWSLSMMYPSPDLSLETITSQSSTVIFLNLQAWFPGAFVILNRHMGSFLNNIRWNGLVTVMKLLEHLKNHWQMSCESHKKNLNTFVGRNWMSQSSLNQWWL